MGKDQGNAMIIISVLLLVLIVEVGIVAASLNASLGVLLKAIHDNIGGFRNETRNFRYPHERPGSQSSSSTGC